MKRSKFSLSHYWNFSLDMGDLVPCGLVEVLPGDTVQHATSVLARASALLAPVMHPVMIRIHHWFVPHRLTWEDFEKFITGGPDGNDASVFPTITLATVPVGSLADKLGVPTDATNLEVSALPFRAYSLIWNEWYRDQDLQTELTVDLTSGADTTTATDLQKSSWEKDYFTSSRPWEQKGDEVTISLTGDAPVRGIGSSGTSYGSTSVSVKESGAVDTTYANARDVSLGGSNIQYVEEDPANAGYPGVYADLSAVGGVTVNQLRESVALQRYKEARARYGSRYTEYLRYLGVRSSDARLQRPEYLGGGRQTLQFSEVLQTAEGANPVGELRGHGISAVRSNRYRRFFEEHGYVISMMNIRPKSVYANGLSRHWNRRVKEDFWQKELQHIGQQEVLNKEVYANHSTPDGTFGYQDRYDEYRRAESMVTSEFRTSALNFWNYARIFGSDPALNSDFVECEPTQRPFAVTTNDVMYAMCHHSIQARRLLSARGTSYTF